MPMDSPKVLYEIYCGDTGNSFTDYAYTVAELMDHCGKLLWGQNLFEVLLMRIRRVEADQPDSLGDTYPQRPDKQPEWIMHILPTDGEVRCRQLESRHEVFAMIVAELALGANMIEVRHITNALAETE